MQTHRELGTASPLEHQEERGTLTSLASESRKRMCSVSDNTVKDISGWSLPWKHLKCQIKETIFKGARDTKRPKATRKQKLRVKWALKAFTFKVFAEAMDLTFSGDVCLEFVRQEQSPRYFCCGRTRGCCYRMKLGSAKKKLLSMQRGNRNKCGLVPTTPVACSEKL